MARVSPHAEAARFRRDGRAVEGARLESVCRATYRGFESHSLRHSVCCCRDFPRALGHSLRKPRDSAGSWQRLPSASEPETAGSGVLRPNTFSTRCVAIATPVNMPQPRIPCTEPHGFDPFERSEPALDRSQVPTRPHPQFQSRYHPESAR